MWAQDVDAEVWRQRCGRSLDAAGDDGEAGTAARAGGGASGGARWAGYDQIGDFHGGLYECEHVSPYTRSAGNCDADVFILLQDWISQEGIAGPFDPETAQLGYTPGLPTNKNLIRLLKRHFGLSLADTYATNLFPFIKPGPMSTAIPPRDLVRAAREFALPQVRLVQPRLVVCLGLQTFLAVQRAATDRRPTSNLAQAIANPFQFESAMVWCQAHTGGLGKANRNRGGIERVSDDWATMSRHLREASAAGASPI